MTNGVINVLKPTGMTSHDVVSFVRRTYGLKKVGHAGTLDPAAAGVLPVFLGKSTRMIEYAVECDKSYRVELTFGYATDTGDDMGTVIAEAPVPAFSEEQLRTVLTSFLGESQQLPPMYSAIKINGKKLYELARAGITVERQPRTITISAITLLKVADKRLLFDVTCSKGTYIRSLCIDIGAKLDCPAVMSFLIRTRVGAMTLAAAHTLEEIAADKDVALQPVDTILSHLPQIVLTEQEATAFQHGRAVRRAAVPSTCSRIYSTEGRLLGIGCQTDVQLSPVKVLPPDID